MAKLRSADEVIVIAGKDKGKRGTVRRVIDSDRVVVSGVNMVKKHTKPNPQAGVAGGIVEQEAPIQASNLALFNSKSGKGERVGYRMDDGKKVRIFKPSGDLVDAFKHHARAAPPGDFGCPIRRVVIDDDNFEIELRAVTQCGLHRFQAGG